MATEAPLQPRGSTRARCRTVLAEAPSAAAPPALSRRSVLAATEPKLLTPSQTFWTGMSELGLGTQRQRSERFARAVIIPW